MSSKDDIDPYSFLRLVRSEALYEYNRLDQHIIALLGESFGAGAEHSRIANLIYTKVVNSRTRQQIVFGILQELLPIDCSVFLKSLGGKLDKVDKKRNEIVHWTEAGGNVENGTLNGFGARDPDRTPVLYHPFSPKSKTDFHTAESILKFCKELRFLIRVVCNFRDALMQYRSYDRPAPLQEISRIKVLYPPPKDHPLESCLQG